MARPASVLLASRSPRRKALLEAAGLRVRVEDPDTDETWPGGEVGAGAIDIARRKLRAVRARQAGAGREVAIAADTVVVLDDVPLGKPEDAGDAVRMLGRLSGREHVVVTGFCVSGTGGGAGSGTAGGEGGQREGAVHTAVRFRALTAAEIERYVQSGEPLDKAGAYGIQGLGGALVDSVRGSYTNVVGLPLAEVLAAIEDLWAEVVAGGPR